jgi:hypothetical protein
MRNTELIKPTQAKQETGLIHHYDKQGKYIKSIPFTFVTDLFGRVASIIDVDGNTGKVY